MSKIEQTDNSGKKKIEFEDLPEKLRKILTDSDGYFILISLQSGVYLPHYIFLGRKNHDQARKKIREELINTDEKEVILFIYRMLYNPIKGAKDSRQIVTFEEIFNHYSSITDNTSTRVSPNKHTSNGFFLRSNDGGVGGSVPRPEMPEDRFERLGEKIQKKLKEYNLFISEIPRDHNINAMGKLDPAGDLFASLCKHFNLDFSNRSRWATIVPAIDGLYFSIRLNVSGHIMIWVNPKLSWREFIKQFFRIFDFLKFEDKSKLLELIEDDQRKIFILETANMIGPKPIVDKHLKKACLKVVNFYDRGIYREVLTKIDYSIGPPEVEWIGASRPTRKFQAILAESELVAQALGPMEHKIEENLEVGTQILAVQSGITETLDHIDENYGNLYSQNIELKDSFDNIHSSVQIIQNNQNLIHNKQKGIIDVTIDQTKELKDYFHENQEEVIGSITHLGNSISKKIDQLEKSINENFKDQNQRFKANLYLVLRGINNIPGATINVLKREFDIKKGTLYRYLKKLQGADLIKSEKDKPLFPRRGRRLLRYFRK